MKRQLVASVLVTLVAATAAATARADGDPASDYLITQQAFLPFDAKFAPSAQQQLLATLTAARRAGFTIRVAIISSPYDLGAITSLWAKPRTYARFLGEELGFVYKQRLLVVMPGGFGFNWPHHSPQPAYKVLEKTRIEPGPAGLIAAAQSGVRELAGAAGVKISPQAVAAARGTSPAARNSHDRIVILLVAVLLVAGAVVGSWLLRRRRRQLPQ